MIIDKSDFFWGWKIYFGGLLANPTYIMRSHLLVVVWSPPTDRALVDSSPSYWTRETMVWQLHAENGFVGKDHHSRQASVIIFDGKLLPELLSSMENLIYLCLHHDTQDSARSACISVVLWIGSVQYGRDGLYCDWTLGTRRNVLAICNDNHLKVLNNKLLVGRQTLDSTVDY